MAFAGLGAFDKNFCRLMSNQPINSVLDYPGAIGKAFMEAGRNRINENRGLMRKIRNFKQDGDEVTMDNIGKLDVAKSMFYNRNGDLSYGRVGAAGAAGLAGTAIAGSYIFGGD